MDTQPTLTRADQIFAAFKKYHRANPTVWKNFERFALNVAATGRKCYSSNAIFERLRWHLEFEVKDSEVKLNNNYRAYYARLFHLAHPEYNGFFRNRKRTSEERSAATVDIQVFKGEAASDEEEVGTLAGLETLLQEIRQAESQELTQHPVPQ